MHRHRQQPHHYPRRVSCKSNDRSYALSTYVLFIGMHYPTGIRTGGMQHMIIYWRRFHKYINKAGQKKRSILQGVQLQKGRSEWEGEGEGGRGICVAFPSWAWNSDVVKRVSGKRMCASCLMRMRIRIRFQFRMRKFASNCRPANVSYATPNTGCCLCYCCCLMQCHITWSQPEHILWGHCSIRNKHINVLFSCQHELGMDSLKWTAANLLLV